KAADDGAVHELLHDEAIRPLMQNRTFKLAICYLAGILTPLSGFRQTFGDPNDPAPKLSPPGLTERAKREVGRMRLVLQPGAQLGQAASGADPQGLRGGSRMVLLRLEGGSSAGQGPVAARSGNANQLCVPVNSRLEEKSWGVPDST